MHALEPSPADVGHTRHDKTLCSLTRGQGMSQNPRTDLSWSCAIRANSNHLCTPMRGNNIKDALDEDKHVLAGVVLVHWDGDEMKVVEFPIDIDLNAV